MSKSDTDFKNRIDLTDSPDIILQRIKQALTDFTSAVTYEPENRPGVSNLILIHSLCTGKSFEDICLESSHLNTGQYKLVVAEAVIEYLRPIQARIKEYMDDPLYLSQILKEGSDKAMDIACKTIVEVKEAVGLSHLSDCKSEVKLKI